MKVESNVMLWTAFGCLIGVQVEMSGSSRTYEFGVKGRDELWRYIFGNLQCTDGIRAMGLGVGEYG